jgi:hypothetical protein
LFLTGKTNKPKGKPAYVSGDIKMGTEKKEGRTLVIIERVCAWCDTTMGHTYFDENVIKGIPRKSHGICGLCMEEILEKNPDLRKK